LPTYGLAELRGWLVDERDQPNIPVFDTPERRDGTFDIGDSSTLQRRSLQVCEKALDFDAVPLGRLTPAGTRQFLSRYTYSRRTGKHSVRIEGVKAALNTRVPVHAEEHIALRVGGSGPMK